MGSSFRGLAIAASTLLIAGCSTNSADTSGDSPPTRVREDGRLATDPAPLTIRELKKTSLESPERAIFELWFWGQWGSAPNIVQSYDPVVRETVLSSNIVGSYASIRPSLLGSRPRVTSIRTTEIGTFVAIDVVSRTERPVRHSFLLRRRGKRWYVVFDTLLESALPGYVQTIVAKDPDAKPSGDAVRQGLASAARYRDAYTAALGGSASPE